MEVNIALLLVAVGLMGLLSLFSVGLRQSGLATSDTTQASFADGVFNSMHANAGTITNWVNWTNAVTFSNMIMSGITALPPAATANQIVADGSPHQINDYLIGGHYVTYMLNLKSGSVPSIWQAWIQVIDNQYMAVSNSPVYATAFVYMGM